MQEPLAKYAALLYREWERGIDPDTIVGHWAEDDSTYEIKVPHQLRDAIIELHNKIQHRYLDVRNFEHEATARRLELSHLIG